MKGFGENKNTKLSNLNFNRKDNNSYLKKQLNLARHYLSSGNIILAEKIYSELLNNGIKSYDLLFSYALLARTKSNFLLAKKLLNQSISDYPSQTEQYVLLADILRLENNFSKAEELLLFALKINPNNSNTNYNLSLLYRALNLKENALKRVNIAIKYSYNNYIYKLLKADLLKDLNKFKESELILLELVANQNIKDKKEILLMLALVKRFDSDFIKAEQILLETIKLYPNFSKAYLNLSNLYFDQKLLLKAKEIILKGIEIDSMMPEMFTNLGIIFRNLGEINEAKKNLLKAISLNRNLFNSYLELSTFYDFSRNTCELEYILNVPVKGLNNEDIVSIYFSRGNIYHNQKKFNEAELNYKLGNDLKRKLYRSNKEYLLRRSIQIKEQYFNSKSNKQIDNLYSELIFIVGMPRSGSTLLENILSLNKEVVDLGEIEILSDILINYNTSDKGENPYEKYINKINKFYPNFKIATDKNLFNYINCPVIDKYFENSKIIYCLRNPLDNIISIYRSNFTKIHFSTDIKDITELYIHHYELMKLYSKTYKKNLLLYNYDELVMNPDVEIKKIIDWLGWEWSNIYLSPHKNKRSVFTASSEQVRNPIHTKSLRGWEKYKDLLKPAYSLIKKNKDLKNYLNI